MAKVKIAGICTIRNEADIMPLLCGHYLRLGFDRLAFLDGNSTDGTFETLKHLSERFPQISVEKDQDSVFRQEVIMTDLANQVIREGYHVVFPFDADEFWNIDITAIKKIAETVESGHFIGFWTPFAQARTQLYPSKLGLLNVKYSASGNDEVSFETMNAFTQSFIFAKYPKIGFISREPVELTKGQHGLAKGPTTCLRNDLELFHIPLRSASMVLQRGNMAHYALETAKQGEAWQTRFFQNAVNKGMHEKVWEANSVDKAGTVQLGDKKVSLIPDTRFRNAIARSMLYLTARGYFSW